MTLPIAIALLSAGRGQIVLSVAAAYYLRQDRAAPTEQVARQGACVILIDYDNSIHDHHFNTFRVLMRTFECGPVGNRHRVEEHEIGSVSLRNRAAVLEAQCGGSAAGHFVNGLR